MFYVVGPAPPFLSSKVLTVTAVTAQVKGRTLLQVSPSSLHHLWDSEKEFCGSTGPHSHLLATFIRGRCWFHHRTLLSAGSSDSGHCSRFHTDLKSFQNQWEFCVQKHEASAPGLTWAVYSRCLGFGFWSPAVTVSEHSMTPFTPRLTFSRGNAASHVLWTTHSTNTDPQKPGFSDTKIPGGGASFTVLKVKYKFVNKTFFALFFLWSLIS